MSDDPRQVTYIGVTDFRNQNTKFGIRAKDRLRHIYVVGATGVGKSVLLENLCIQDIQNGNGVAVLDPHGTLAEKVLDFIPEHRIEDVIYFAPFDLDNPLGFNPLEDPGPDLRYQVADGLLAAFKKIWPDAFSARMEYILSMTLLALLEYPESTLLSVNRMLADKPFRMHVLEHVRDPSVRAFWIDEFNKWEDKFAREASAAIQNKVGQFTSNPLIRNILGQPKSTINFRQIMDEKKIFIANLSKGRVGEQNAPLLGAMLITKMYLAAMSRADKTEYEMNFIPPFYMFVDEFQNFANDSFENILSESRKYKLSLTVAHQYIEQMPDTIKAAVFGNVGTKIVFRTQKAEDAEMFEKVFAPVFIQQDIINLQLAQIYLTLMIDGVGSQPFSARTLPPTPNPPMSYRAQALEASRRKYTRPRSEVESEISAWYAPAAGTPPPPDRPKKVDPEKEAAHKQYLAEKRAEVERRGGVWLDPDEYKAAKENNTLDELIARKKAESRVAKAAPSESSVVPAVVAGVATGAAVAATSAPLSHADDTAAAPRAVQPQHQPRMDTRTESARPVNSGTNTYSRDTRDTNNYAGNSDRGNRPVRPPRDDRQNYDRPPQRQQQPERVQAEPVIASRPEPVVSPIDRSSDRVALPETRNSLRDAIVAALGDAPVRAQQPSVSTQSTPPRLTNNNQGSQYKEHGRTTHVPVSDTIPAKRNDVPTPVAERPNIRPNPADPVSRQPDVAASVRPPARPDQDNRPINNRRPDTVANPISRTSTPVADAPVPEPAAGPAVSQSAGNSAPYNAWSEVSPDALAQVLRTSVW